MIFNAENGSFIGINSRLKQSDCFMLSSVLKKNAVIEEEQVADEKVKPAYPKNKKLFCWSIEGNIHVLDFNTFEWQYCEKENLNDPQSMIY
jgi:translation elongation factor P/translation initiation factor 5A